MEGLRLFRLPKLLRRPGRWTGNRMRCIKMSASFDDLISRVKECDKKVVAVAAAEDDAVLEAVSAAHAQGIADAILVGDEAKIREIAAGLNIDLTGWRI